MISSSELMSLVTHIECSGCGKSLPPNCVYDVCPACSLPLLVRYDLQQAKRSLTRGEASQHGRGIWKYRSLMPGVRDENVVTLGEGSTPLLRARRLGSRMSLSQLFIKDESLNPTGSFKARGMAAAVSMAKELGIRKIAVPSAGNAASAMAAYAARAGLEAHIFMPKDVPSANCTECKVFGAHVTLVDGVITDCGRAVAERKVKEGWFDLSTLKEPYRLEGKKTMGYELAEQLNWQLPDWIVYPAGGGTGLIGLWKAFDEMEEMGWISSNRPRMVVVQSSGCAPIVKAFHEGKDRSAPWPNAHTIASGLRVPSAIADFLMLRILRASGGTAVMVDDDEIKDAVRELGSTEGLFCAPEPRPVSELWIPAKAA